MLIRYTGALLTLLSGALYAVFITKEHRKKERNLEELLLILEHFAWELQTNLTPLSGCCMAAGRCGRGEMGQLFLDLAERLERGGAMDPAQCMALTFAGRGLPSQIQFRLCQLSDTLGRYDLSGQIAGIQAVQELCRRDLKSLVAERSKSLKSCQALGLCTGAAVAILLL